VSFIGSLEQFDLANILRRLEVFSKTGLLVVKQRDIWVEFYFRQGQLVCIGPMRANASLVDRLLQADLLSQQSLPQVRALIDPSESNETRIALALINEGYLSREILRAWASHETSQILRAIFSWPAGEIYFEEERPTPPDRLLVALSISALLDTLTASAAPRPAGLSGSSANEPAHMQDVSARSAPVTSVLVDVEPDGRGNASFLEPASVPVAASTNEEGVGLLSASQLIDDLPFNLSGTSQASQPVEIPPPSFAQAAPAKISFGAELDISSSNQVSLLPPQPVPNPLPPARIDTSFMTPDLVLVPVDLSSLRERNPQVQLTPDQWRLFALVDGQTSLQMLCQALMASADQVRAVAGELMAIGLVMPQPTGSFNEMPAPVPPAMAPDIASVPSGQYAVVPPVRPPQPISPPPFAQPIATQSQWGNGSNGATFVVGGGWMLSSPQAVPQPTYVQPGAVYVPMGGYR